MHSKAVIELKSGPVFRKGQIKIWLKRKKVIIGTIIATINLKGEVAKTTTTVGLAEVLSEAYNKKVLVIDLDPQTNATTMLIGEEIEPLGIVVTKYRGASTLHNRTLNDLRKGKDAQVFETIFPENNKMAEAAEYISVNTLSQKWGYEGQYNRFLNLASEIIKRYE